MNFARRPGNAHDDTPVARPSRDQCREYLAVRGRALPSGHGSPVLCAVLPWSRRLVIAADSLGGCSKPVPVESDITDARATGTPTPTLNARSS